MISTVENIRNLSNKIIDQHWILYLGLGYSVETRKFQPHLEIGEHTNKSDQIIKNKEKDYRERLDKLRFWSSGLSVRYWPWRLELTPCPSHIKDLKMERDAFLPNSQHYKVKIKSKVMQSRKWSNALLYNSVSSSCRAASTDIPDPLSPLLPIIHRLWQVFRATSRILTEVLYVCSSWSSCFCSAICWGP